MCPLPPSADDGPAETLEFWEIWFIEFALGAWQAKNGPTKDVLLIDDVFAFAEGGKLTFSKDDPLTAEGTFYIVPAISTADMTKPYEPPGGWKPWKKQLIPGWGTAYGTCNLPDAVKKKMKDTKVGRRISYEWNCCPGEEKESLSAGVFPSGAGFRDRPGLPGA